MERFVNQVLNQNVYGYPIALVGETLYISIDEARFVKAGFDIYNCAGKYEILSLTLVSKTSGIIDQVKIRFKSILKDKDNNPVLSKHIWLDYKNNLKWYEEPTEKDLESIRNTIKHYIEVVK